MAEDGELAAVFRGLAEDSAQAGDDIGESIARFTEATADNEDANVARLLDTDSKLARTLDGIRATADDDESGVPSGGGGDGGDSGGGDPGDGSPGGAGDPDPRLTPGTPEYERYVDELAKDPAHGDLETPATRQEAIAAVRAEAAGQIPGPLERAPFDENGRDQGDFVDSTGQHWDVKSSPDIVPPWGNNPGDPIPHPQSIPRFIRTIDHELERNQHVLLDPHDMTPGRLAALRQVVADHPAWRGRVIWAP